ncbi:MAG TPA: polysaccharide deacetylase family protein [Anaerovoracaceae bacterium]|nr:polysaccharide deacetylase family protein [Anaerovoracaceae bacterium]
MLIPNLLLTAKYRLRGINLKKELASGSAKLPPCQEDNQDESKFICLTFDDGPSQHTVRLLDILKENDVKATFFLVATFARENREIIDRMKAEGHTLALHTFEHKCPLFENEEYTKHAFDKSMDILTDLGISPRFFRPAWGTFNRVNIAKAREYGLKPILWNVMAEDWQGNTTDDIIFKKLIKRTKPYDVVCLHDGRGENNAPGRTIKALERAIPMWKRRGFRFVTIGDIFDE